MKITFCVLAFSGMSVLAQTVPEILNWTNVGAMGLVGGTLYAVFFHILPARDKALADLQVACALERKDDRAQEAVARAADRVLFDKQLQGFLAQLSEQRNTSSAQLERALAQADAQVERMTERFIAERSADRDSRHRANNTLQEALGRLAELHHRCSREGSGIHPALPNPKPPA